MGAATLPLSTSDSVVTPHLNVRFETLLWNVPDPERVRRYFEEFQNRHPAALRRIADNGDQLVWLTCIFGVSRFLSEELLRHPDWILDVGEVDQTLSCSDYSDRLENFLRGLEAGTPTALELAMFRRKELLRIAIRDRTERATLSEITEEISNLADAILRCALQEVLARIEKRYGSPLTNGSDSQPENRQAKASMAVLALGKLGGRELNYSSDVDLMFLYSVNGETAGPERITNKEFFQKVANEFTNLLSTYTAAGQCYRVDLRLRPEGSHGEVCLSLGAATQYYARRARDWEIQMVLKARAAAGDAALGRKLLDFVAPLIYSTKIDFSTIETMSATRERIHEKVSRRRLASSKLDVKLAGGGIRDIEFLAQCLQRLHGSQDDFLRNAGTLQTLDRLHERDLLSTTEYKRLTEAYQFLRKLEHILQLEDDRQTHALPVDPRELESIAIRMSQCWRLQNPGISAATSLLKELNEHLENVQAIYERIIRAQRPLHYAPQIAAAPEAPGKGKETPDTRFQEALLKELSPLAPRLARRLREGHLQGSEERLARFLQSARSSGQLELLDGHPALMDWTIQLLELSPFLTEQLTRFPELLTEVRLASDDPGRRYAFEGLAAPLNDIGKLRMFFRREMLRIQAQSICLPEPVFQTMDRTSALAEFVIARAYRIALENALKHARSHATPEKPFQDPKEEMMVVALGRLGMREFDLASDADLVFIIPDSEAAQQRFWTRVAERLIDILSAYTDEGPILSLDTRLRPDGREGPLVQTESKYVEYFANRAETWEGIAYMKARAVAGDTDRATKFLIELQQVDWRRYGQGGRSKHSLFQMRLRLEREQAGKAPLKAAHGGYYDADFILMYLRLKGAGMFFKSLNTPERIDVVEKMGHLERADAEFLLEAATHFRALDHALRLVLGHAEGKIPSSPEEQQMVAELMNRWTANRSRAEGLQSDLLLLQDRMHRLFETIFDQ